MKKIIFLLVAGILFTTGCNLIETFVIPSKKLIFPEDKYYDALVRTNGDVTVLVDSGSLSDLQSYAKEGDQNFMKFAFPDDPQCDPAKYESYEVLPDGRLQVWKSCLTKNGNLTYLMAYDWKTGQLAELAGPLPLGSSGASWNPDQTKAIAYLDGGFATRTLYWISKDSFSPLDLISGDEFHSWNLQDDFPDFRADDTGKTGTTGRAAWSPDGKSIAFFAAPDAIGKTGFQRFGVEHNLYLLDPLKLLPVIAASNIYSPFVLAWSPNSTYIAFIGKYGFQKENGLWLLSLQNESIIEISKGIFQSIVWRSSENNLLAIKCENLDVCNEIIEFDLTGVLN